MEIEESDSPLLDLKLELAKISFKKLPLASGCCIYKVPPTLRRVNVEAYTPTTISIGPFHHGDKKLESMQEMKLWYVNKFLKRSNWEEPLELYAKELRDCEDQIRLCYSETIQMRSSEFVSMILTDACFVIEFFLTQKEGKEADPLNKKAWPTMGILLDLILLENQLPFFVLEHLFNLTFPIGFNGRFSFLQITYYNLSDFLANLYPYEDATFENFFLFSHQLEHLCDILRTFYLPCDLPKREFSDIVKHSYTISQLYEAGLKFEAVDQGKRIMELQCSRGVLKMPSIILNDMTETMLVNVVAFEQCHYSEKHYVTDYLILLDSLIDTGKDVQILVEKGIIHSHGDNDVMASMVNKHRINVYEIDTNSDYIPLYRELNNFYDNPFNKYKAIFVREYWSTPWRIASVIAAIVLLLLTFTQTVTPFIKK